MEKGQVGEFVEDSPEHKSLLPHQKVDYLIRNTKCILTHTMGTGRTKTLVRLSQTFITHYHESKQVLKILIVCPKSVANKVWAKEFYKWNIDKDININLLGAGQMQHSMWGSDQSNITIISPDFYKEDNTYATLIEHPPDVVIVDEVHQMCTNAQHTWIKAVTERAGRVYWASGKPSHVT